MFLPDHEIKKRIASGEIKISPCEEGNIQPASLDLRLGSEFLRIEHHETSGVIDLMEKPKYRRIKKGEVIIPPGHFVLGTTLEKISIPDNIVAHIEGRSSIGRRGLFIQNAGWVDPGFNGNITLELYNADSLPIKLQSGTRICQIVFGLMSGKSENPYRGKYLGQRGVAGSKSYLDKK